MQFGFFARSSEEVFVSHELEIAGTLSLDQMFLR